jgi:hypothetical protein
MAAVDHEGGCACGAIRFRVTSQPYDAGYCHCRICQLTSGSPVMAFATAPRGDVVILQGEPATRRSSSFGERWFCRDCGTPLAMVVTHQPGALDIAIATLDDPEVIAPGFHIWTRSQIGWFDTTDQFDRHERFRPETKGLNDMVAAGAPDRPGSTDAAPADDINPLAPPINIEAGA